VGKRSSLLQTNNIMNEEHLKLIQSVISRLANNSFLLRGWAVTLASAILALGSQGRSQTLCFLAIGPAILFAFLDAYYLWQERLFRELYNAVVVGASEVKPFSMDTSFARAHVRYQRSLRSTTVLLFYGGLIALITAVAIVVASLPPSQRS
jgi:hypothetical protein